MYRLQGVDSKYCIVVGVFFWRASFGFVFGALYVWVIVELCIAWSETQGHLKTDHGLEKSK